MRAVDYLLTRDDVDPGRLAITGTSGGGFQATWIARPRPAHRRGRCRPASRPRCPCGWPTASSRTPTATRSRTRRGSSRRESTTPACCCSRTPGRSTSRRPSSTSSRSRGRAGRCGRSRPSIGASGTRDRVALSEGYHKHQYSAENQAKAFAFLDRAFGRPAQAGLAEAKTLAPEALWSTPTGQVREDLGGRSLLEVIRDEFRARPPAAQTLAELYRGGNPGIRDWLVVAFTGAAPRDAIAWEAAGSDRIGAARIERYPAAPQRRARDPPGARPPGRRAKPRAAAAREPPGQARSRGLARSRGAFSRRGTTSSRSIRAGWARRGCGTRRLRSTTPCSPRPTRRPRTRARSPACSRTTSTTLSSWGGRTSSR